VGVLAGSIKSNLEIPPAISRFLSLYLLMALGLKGGFALSKSGLTTDIGISLGNAIALAIFIPCVGYWFLRKFVSGFDAAAVAATYGSVSAVTFVTAVQYLENQNIAYGGHMAAAWRSWNLQPSSWQFCWLIRCGKKMQAPPSTAYLLENSA